VPDQMSPTFRVAVGSDPNSQVVGPGVYNKVTDYHQIRVFWGAVHNGAASDKQGTPVYDKVLQIRHLYPGSGDYLDVAVKRWPAEGGEPVLLDPQRYARYREVLEQFERNDKIKQQGTPLDVLNFDPATIANLKGKQIETVEELSDVPDVAIGALGTGGRSIRDRARAFIEASAGNAPLAKMQAENDGLRADLDLLRDQMRELTQQRDDAKRDAETRRIARADEQHARDEGRPDKAEPSREAPSPQQRHPNPTPPRRS
jgi:hypothetical protein